MDKKTKELTLSKFLLQKYSDLINQREQRTIGEIKSLVDGTDLTIQNIITEFKDSTYDFDENYTEILTKVFNFIKDELEFTEINFGVNYWLSANEVMQIKVVDAEDLAVFTCSCMKALGDTKAEVIIAELDDFKTHAFVSTTINEKFLILDPAQKHDFNLFFDTKPNVIRNYKFNNAHIKRFLYRFNSDKYEQFLED